jgi:DNA-binding MarR family transcriptional regulator
MAKRLRDEIRQGRPFESLEQEGHLGIARTAAVLDHALAEALKAHDITPTQYNVLRILRGAGEGGLCRGEVQRRMVAPVPDVTRILDRMEASGLIERNRDAADRRFVTARISGKGLQLVGKLDDPMQELHREQLGHLTADELRTLIRLLDLVRVAF